MRSRSLLILVLVGIVAVLVGLVALGEFPPQPHTQQVEKVLPNERFPSR
jgi:hypothetical protein